MNFPLFDILRYAAPVGLAAMGETVGQRSGVINIGLEGVLLFGAYAATRASLATGNPWLGLLAGAVIGIILTILVGFLIINMSQDQVVVGTTINLLSLGVCGTLFESASKTSTKLIQLPSFPVYQPLGGSWGRLDIVLIFTVTISFALYIMVHRSAWGLRVRAAGESPLALEGAGFSVKRIRWESLALNNCLAGIGGAYFALGVAGSFATEMIAGRGFLAIALVTFSRWKPTWALASACFVGILELLQYQFQMTNQAIPKSLLLAVPYVVTLIVLVFAGKGSGTPAALGQPFRGMK